MSNSTPQGPGPEFGSNPDATPIDENEALQAELDQEAAALNREGDAGDVIDISDPEGPELTGGAEEYDAE